MRQRIAGGQNTKLIVGAAVGSIALVIICASVAAWYVRTRRIERNLRTYANRHYNIRNETVTDAALVLSKYIFLWYVLPA